MPTGDLITQKEAAAILNRSVSAVSRAIKDGRLECADPKRRLIFRPGLEARFAHKTRPRIDMPQRKMQARPMQLEDQPQSFASNYWERLQQKLDLVLSGAPYYCQQDPNSHQLMCFLSDSGFAASAARAGGIGPLTLLSVLSGENRKRFPPANPAATTRAAMISRDSVGFVGMVEPCLWTR